MTKEEFLNINEEEMINFLINNEKDKDGYLNYLKIKKKPLFFKISGKLKSVKLNANSMKQNEEIEQGILEIDLDKISPNPYQPRIQFSKQVIEEMANSIEEHDLIQPISLNKISDDNYEIIAGETRYRAFKYLKRNKIPAVVICEMKKDEPTYKSIMIAKALIENVSRKDLYPIELAMSFKNALDNGIYKNAAALAKTLGKQKIYITKVLSVLKLNEQVLRHLSENKKYSDIEALYYLQKISDPEVQYKKYIDFFENKITRADLVNYIKELSGKSEIEKDEFLFKMTNNKLTIQSNFKTFDKEKKENFEKDLEELIKKYSL